MRIIIKTQDKCEVRMIAMDSESEFVTIIGSGIKKAYEVYLAVPQKSKILVGIYKSRIDAKKVAEWLAEQIIMGSGKIIIPEDVEV